MVTGVPVQRRRGWWRGKGYTCIGLRMRLSTVVDMKRCIKFCICFVFVFNISFKDSQQRRNSDRGVCCGGK